MPDCGWFGGGANHMFGLLSSESSPVSAGVLLLRCRGLLEVCVGELRVLLFWLLQVLVLVKIFVCWFCSCLVLPDFVVAGGACSERPALVAWGQFPTRSSCGSTEAMASAPQGCLPHVLWLLPS